jgi:hypothetical protein
MVDKTETFCMWRHVDRPDQSSSYACVDVACLPTKKAVTPTNNHLLI